MNVKKVCPKSGSPNDNTRTVPMSDWVWHVHAKQIISELGLIAEYPNKFIWKRWQTQRFVRLYVPYVVICAAS